MEAVEQMTAPYLGGLEITKAAAIGPGQCRVYFTSTYSSDYHYQLYVGRTLSGVTTSTSQRSIVGQFIPSSHPEHVTILAVDPADRYTDYGSYLPPRPYNQVKLKWTTTGWSPNTRFCMNSMR